MKLPLKDRFLWPIGVLALAVVLILLAVLQYKWTQELNEAAGDRMRAGLQASMVGLREDLGRELLSIPLALQVDWRTEGVPTDPESYLERLDTWRRTATHPDLAEEFFVADAVGDRIQLRTFNADTQSFAPVDWPSKLAPLQAPLSAMSSDMQFFSERFKRSPHRIRNLDHFVHHGPPSLPWMVDENIPALVHPLVAVQAGPEKTTQVPQDIEWLIIVLNEDVLRQKILPELAQRFFGGSDGLTYDVAVISRAAPNRVFYTSNPHFGSGTNVPTDARLRLFGPPIGRPEPPRQEGLQAPGDDARRGDRSPMFSRGLLRLEPFHTERAASPDWELIVRHRKGSLEAALAATRRGHLAISFGVLLLLAATIAMLIAVTRRAHRLASLQMQFVAGISHELRTPLAVIASAADNIADGIVQDRAKLARYGKVIRDQSRQLTQLVEQILLFAAARQNGHQYNIRPSSPVQLVNTALANSAELVRNAGFTVERRLESTSDVIVDVAAVTHCLQNLIANAVKYGGEARWIGIGVNECDNPGGKREVQISVQDKGLGIEPGEQQRIFDAFYRSPSVLGAQIHGTGLGLALAKGVAEAMGGRLTVTSTPGEGSTFVLHLPCADASAAEPQQEETVTASTARRD